MPKKKYYVVWAGRKTGVFTSWKVCKAQIDGYEGAQYKSFTSLDDAVLAFSKKYLDYKGKNTKRPVLSSKEKEKYGSPILESIAVDAACSGNPGKMEYRGVFTHNKKEIFKKGPYLKGTNNIGEFLALVHGIALLNNKNKEDIPIYSDSKIAMSWVRQKKCKTNIHFDASNKDLLELIKRAENWLQNNSFKNPILKWETKAWGEIPADFGRK
ncbi:ribonuclease H1 domain-containing protein [Polaribacter porphyrae]|uniref:Ribonuclease H n=1 Tax=Polaribacter porphyrae TaxID=1137780 RepID=A0A2S7WQA2_9FLAO|nr:ribonuclease H family protein [Polaribacter porphyrae]PQJ79787.1 ribonuclease H [Polaribacter porphyrae]